MATLDTTCPMCGTPHARKLSVIYEEGHSVVRSNIQTVGKTNTLAQVKITTQGTSEGVQQSAASIAAAPPHIPPLRPQAQLIQGLVRFGSLAGCVFVVAVGAVNEWGFVKSLFAGGLVGGLGFSFGQVHGNQPTPDEIARHRQRYQDAFAALDKWNITFACGSCGQRFIPRGVEQTVAA